MRFFTIESISNWDKETGKEERVCLPVLQRGFVWKPEQISNLWDSILRGFPIGSFLLAVNHANGSKELLDGQQRSTSIMTGFYNQFENENTGFFSLKRYPSIWIDITPAEMPEENQFCVHVVTQSHPWGFKAKNPAGGLSLSERQAALKHYATLGDFSNYLEINPKFLAPWDSVCPIPLCFLLELKDVRTIAEFENNLSEKLKGLKIKTRYSDLVNYSEVIKHEHYLRLFTGIQNAKKLIIPELIIDIESITLKEENAQDPTLFVRLNAGGTRLGGEELVYSIFKAYFPECKELIEKISAEYISPSRLINLFAKVAQATLQNKEEHKHISFIKSIDIRTFKRLIQQDDYRNALKHLITNEENGVKERFDFCLSVLKTEKLGIPVVLIKQMLSSNTDLFYILLSYLEKNNISGINEISDRDVSVLNELIVHLSWFSIDKNKAVARLFQLLLNEDPYQKGVVRDDWGLAKKTLIEEKLIFPLITPEDLKTIFTLIAEKRINLHSDEFRVMCQSGSVSVEPYNFKDEADVSKLRDFIERIRFNKDLILFAQRKYIVSEFEVFNQFQNIEDTNRPWDWDHIYPQSWVYYRKDIHHLIKQWINSIGNFRALSIAENRSENNRVSPKERLADAKRRVDYFVDNDDYDKYWSNFSQIDLRVIDEDDVFLSHYLNAVLSRTQKIYTEWFNNFANY